ncbi:MAG: hypothetical protein MHPSP_002510, partial [Paramarteilia canceri]
KTSTETNIAPIQTAQQYFNAIPGRIRVCIAEAQNKQIENSMNGFMEKTKKAYELLVRWFVHYKRHHGGKLEHNKYLVFINTEMKCIIVTLYLADKLSWIQNTKEIKMIQGEVNKILSQYKKERFE